VTVTGNHALAYSLGEESPLARIYELDGTVLLLGVGYDSNTSFHLAEYRIPMQRQIVAGAPIREHGQRVWQWYPDIDLDTEPFEAIGAAFEQHGDVKHGHVGLAHARVFAQRAAVDHAQQWLLHRATSC
jgi:aminoglycoside 3-N-acetyltransferase